MSYNSVILDSYSRIAVEFQKIVLAVISYEYLYPDGTTSANLASSNHSGKGCRQKTFRI